MTKRVKPFSVEVSDAFRDLLESDWIRWDSSEHDAAYFGNSAVVLHAPTFLLRLVRDRGDTYAEVASLQDPDEWLPLPWVVSVARGDELSLPKLITPMQAAAMLAPNMEGVSRVLAPPEYERS